MSVSLRSIAAFLCLFACLPAGPAAGQDPRAKEILETAGVRGGLVVHLGCGDGTLTAGLRAHDGLVVHGLDADPANVERARASLRAKGLYGPVAVDVFDGRRLPYVDNLVNLLVADDPGAVPKDEILRVLAPAGVALLGGKKEVKPRPAAIDEWTHYLHGPDNNAVSRDTVAGPPRHMQWLGDPLWTRNHHRLNSISSVVTARGRLFYIVDEATSSNMGVPGKWSILARDAFSGVQLWKKPMSSWAWHGHRFRSGPPQVTRLLVVSGDRLYAPLGLSEPVSEMDAATGKTLRTFAETGGAEEIVLAGGTLLVLKGDPAAEHAVGHEAFKDSFKLPNRKTVVAVDAGTGKALWTWTDPGAVRPETLASDGDRVYVKVDEGVACLDLKSGKPAWTTEGRGEEKGGKPGKKKGGGGVSFGTHVLVVADGVVLSDLGGSLTALSAADGKKLWECEGGGGFHAPPDIFVIGGLVWQGSHVKDSVAPPPVHDFNEGRDLKTGEVRKKNQVMVDLQTSGHHHRCYREKATERYIITGKRGIEMMDLAGDEHFRANWVRGTCQYGVMPANGLMYAPSHCCGCYMESKLWGFWALAAERSVVTDPARRAADGARLEKGPAFGKPAEGAAGAESWPQYRHDPRRSGIAGTELAAKPAPAWKAEVGGRLTPPVISGGKVLVASVDEGTVTALDEATGKTLWTFVAGGRVDSPPAVHDGRVLFGSADGRVTCLRLDDGALVWRFLAAPADVRAVALDQVESLWPVPGSVLVLGGVAYCAAGRSSWLDGGIDLYGLEPATGRVVCKARLESRHPKYQDGKGQAKAEHETKVQQNTTDYKTFLQPDLSDSFSMAGGALNDVLVSDGRDVYLRQVRFDAKLERQEKMARHLFSTSSLLDGQDHHRSHYVLGTGDFSRVGVAYSWIVDRGERGQGVAAPTGLLMVYDDNAVWGVQRQGDASGKYQLFRRKNAPLPGKEPAQPDITPASKDPEFPFEWKLDLPARPRAMLKSGKRLFLGTMPAEIPEDDPHAAYEGRRGGAIRVVSAEDGSTVAEIPVESPAVWDGLAAAGGRLYFSTMDGKVVCMR